MPTQEVEEFLLAKMRESKLPSLAAAVVKGREVVYARALGFRDLESGLPATPGTIYGIGSITKMFTALAVMQLRERGLVDLDDPLAKYGLGLTIAGEDVTIRHLLTHTSGVPALGYAEALIDGITGARDVWLPLATPEDVLAFMRGADSWAVDRPGRRMFYLNEGYVLLGKIIEAASGLSYWDYIKRNILAPLGMRRTYLLREEVERDGDVAAPYIMTRRGPLRSRIPFGISSDGGLLSNALDLSKFLATLINRGTLEQQIISKESLEAMERAAASWNQQYLTGEDYAQYGLGVMSYKFFDVRVLGHSGSVGVYTAFLGYIPEEDIGVVLLANSSGYPLAYMGLYTLAAATGRDPNKLPFIRYEKTLKALEGVYETWKGAYRLYLVVRNWVPYIVERTRYGATEIPLFPTAIADDEVVFTAIVGGRRLVVTATLNPPTLLYERYKLVKKS
ncbi:MAG: serine hydrolase [Thermoproteus sp. AZ2]|jgi:CubicO group peptidase (beta-lactamase class C family)|uniref:Serine hydrolase n=1 Tax=Thermoproteus sp. AZ2 TaxID=1609232 RepID=A0ACC6V141_9CREN